MKKLWLTIYIVCFSIIMWSNVFAGEDPIEKHKKSTRMGLLLGYSSYEMGDFNSKLSREGNNTINGGMNIGVIFSPGNVKIPWFEKAVNLPIVGLEYLEASSKTTHTEQGNSATVNWELPVLGFFFAPDFEVGDDDIKWFFRPSVGYYTLGKLSDAKLTISDRPGSLNVSDDTLSFSGKLGVKYVTKKYEAVIEGGYRFLKFTGVSQDPVGGFTESSGGGTCSTRQFVRDS